MKSDPGLKYWFLLPITYALAFDIVGWICDLIVLRHLSFIGPVFIMVLFLSIITSPVLAVLAIIDKLLERTSRISRALLGVVYVTLLNAWIFFAGGEVFHWHVQIGAAPWIVSGTTLLAASLDWFFRNTTRGSR